MREFLFYSWRYIFQQMLRYKPVSNHLMRCVTRNCAQSPRKQLPGFPSVTVCVKSHFKCALYIFVHFFCPCARIEMMWLLCLNAVYQPVTSHFKEAAILRKNKTSTLQQNKCTARATLCGMDVIVVQSFSRSGLHSCTMKILKSHFQAKCSN